MMMLEMMIQMIEHFSMHVNTFEKKTHLRNSRQKLHKILDTTSRFVVCQSLKKLLRIPIIFFFAV